MAKMTTLGITEFEDKLSYIGLGCREAVKKAVMAGAEKFIELERGSIQQNRHIKTGSMMQDVKAGSYYEDVGGGYTYVYPQGTDPKGVRQATKAFVINYGIGGKKTKKTGDKFITKIQKSSATEVQEAMTAAYNEALAGK